MDFHILSLQGLLICAAYLFAGIIDSISGGGGLITVPVMLATGIPASYITGTNQCSAFLGTYAAVYRYVKSKRVHFPSALVTLPFSVMGAVLGAKLNLLMPERYLEIFMIVMVPVIAGFLLLNKKLGEADRIDTLTKRQIVLRSMAIGLVIGTYQGFYGPGGGTFFMLAFAAFLKLSLVSATGNTRFIVSISSIASVLTYALSGVIIWKIVLAATLLYMLGSYIGAGLAIKNGSKLIRPITLGVTGLLLIKILFF